MGAWSHEPFGNDDANDWAYDLEGKTDLSLISEALDRVLEADYVEAPEGSEGVAAVEVLAKLLGKGTQIDSYTEEIDEWVGTISIVPDATVLEKARGALAKILSEDSELRELWEESGSEEWVESIRKLQGIVDA